MRTNFNLRKKKSKTPTLILLVIRWNNKKIVYSTKESIHPKFWEDDKTKRNYQRVKETKSYPEYPEQNQRLSWFESTAKSVFRKYQNDNNGKSPSVDELKSLLDSTFREKEVTKDLNLFQFIEQYIDESKSKYNPATGRPTAKGSIMIYRNTLRVLKEYAQRKKKRIDFDTIDMDFYYDYVNYLAVERNLANNTIGKHFQMIRSFLNDATERGLNSNMTFKSKKFKVLSEKATSIYLNEDELNEMYNLDLSNNKRLERVRDLFIIGCWTGLRFSDYSKIKAKNINGNFIEIQTKKTGAVVVIPIHKTVQEIMKRYSDYPNSLPPTISNVKTNNYLKEVGQLMPSMDVTVEVKRTVGGKPRIFYHKKHELIVSHSARRSFATNLYKSGLSSAVIMRLTGHTTEESFNLYIKANNTETAELVRKHWENLNKTNHGK